MHSITPFTLAVMPALGKALVVDRARHWDSSADEVHPIGHAHGFFRQRRPVLTLLREGHHGQQASLRVWPRPRAR